MPSCDQTGTPAGFDGFLHFTSSTTSGSASLMSLRTRASIAPRQSPIPFDFFTAAFVIFLFLVWRVTDRLDVVAVGIENKGGVVVGMIVRPQAWPPVVSAAGP